MKQNKKTIIVVLITIVVAGGLLLFFGLRDQGRINTENKQASEAGAIIEKVGTLIVLPNNETPTVATVSNPDILSSQPFFKNAKLGDKVLIYTKAQKAILYDPVIHKIIEVAPINLGPTAN